MESSANRSSSKFAFPVPIDDHEGFVGIVTDFVSKSYSKALEKGGGVTLEPYKIPSTGVSLLTLCFSISNK